MKKDPLGDVGDLRKRAEERLVAQHQRLSNLSEKGMEQLVHELGTHQIELEMQNEELKRAQAELENLMRRYTDLYEFAPIGYFMLDEKGVVHSVNAAGARMLRVEKDRILRMPFSRFIVKDDRDDFFTHLRNVFGSQMKQAVELRLRGKGEAILYAQFESIISEDYGDEASQCRTAVIDITERKQAEERTRHLASFPQLNPNPVIEVDSSGKVSFFNPATEKILENLGMDKGDINVFFPAEIDDFLGELEKKGETTFYREVTIKDRVFSEVISLTPDFNVARIYAYDITERKKAEAEIKRRTIALEEANRELEGFSYSVAHDLRAPLRHMTGFADLLEKRSKAQLDEKSLHYVSVISESSRKLGILIDDLLALSRIGRAEIRMRRVSLTALVKEVLREMHAEVEGRDIAWKIGKLSDVYGDASMLKLVVANLISNAVKFTGARSRAEIEIGCREEKDESVFFVKDNGIGFDMKYEDKLFGVFQRLHHTQDEFKGTGIGLANVRRIISRHGGRAWAEGAVGQGATFYVTLPKTKEI